MNVTSAVTPVQRLKRRCATCVNTPGKATAALILLVAALQLLGASRLGFGVDEAHYALYGRFPALSYFDHPPMVGWLQWIMLHIGNSEFVLRILPIFMLALSALTLYGLTSGLYPKRTAWTGFIAVVILQSALMFHLIGMGMLPDGPLLLFGLVAMLLLVRIARGSGGPLWLALGVLLGLAALSKYTAITLVISVALTLIVFGRLEQLRKPWPWLGAVTALLLCAPIVVWNVQHDWISIRYQLDHGAGGNAWQIRRFLETQAGQFAAYSPGHYVFGWLAAIVAIKNWPRTDAGHRLCIIFGLPILLLFAVSGGYSRGLPHWPALGWAAFAPMAACFIMDRWRRSRAVRIGARLTLGYAAAALLLLNVLGHIPVPAPAYMHPLEDLLGWDDAALRAVTLREQMAREHPDAEPVIFARRWTHASRLAWYSYPERVIVLSSRNKQFHIWYGEPAEGQSGILILYLREATSPEQAAKRFEDWFENLVWIDSLPVTRGGNPVADFYFYRAFGLKTTPE